MKNFSINSAMEDYKVLTEPEFFKKHVSNIKTGLTLSEITASLDPSTCLDETFDVYYRVDVIGYYIFKINDNLYELFWAERGGKHWRRIFKSLEDAAKSKVLLVLDNCGYAVIDVNCIEEYLNKISFKDNK